MLVLGCEFGAVQAGNLEANEVLANLEFVSGDVEVLLAAVLPIGVDQERLELVHASLLVVDEKGALHGPAECRVIGEQPTHLHRVAHVVVGQRKLEVQDVHVLEDGERPEETLDQDLADLSERVEGFIETGAALVELTPIGLGGQAGMHEGGALEASEALGVLGVADAGEEHPLVVKDLDDGIGAVAGDVLLHHVLLLLRGSGLHGQYCNFNYNWRHLTPPFIKLDGSWLEGGWVQKGADMIRVLLLVDFESMGYHKEVTKQSVILGIYFMLTYTTFLSFSCIITYIAEHDTGQYSYAPLVALSVNYTTYLVALVFSTAITKFKWQFQMSAIAHLINYAVYIPCFEGAMGLVAGIVGAVFGGYGAAIYWVSQGGYLMKLFKRYGIPKNQEGKYFGITNGIVYGSSLFGAIVTTFGLGYFGDSIYFTILTGLSFISWLVCTLFLDSLEKQEKNESLLSEGQKDSIATLTVPERKMEATPKASMCEQAKTIFLRSVHYYPKMYYMLIVIVLDGLISGFISTNLNKLIDQGIRSRLNVGYQLMTEGVGCIFGAMLSAFLSDHFQVINVGRAGLAGVMLASILTFANYLIEPQTMLLPLLVGLSWGFVINYLTSWESVSCAKINDGCLESFSIVRQSQSIVYIFFTVAMITTDNVLDIPYFLCALGVFCVCGLFAFLIHERSQLPSPGRLSAGQE